MGAIGDDEWVDALADRLADVDVDPGLRLVVQQSLAGPTPVSWHLVIADGSIAVHRGAHPEPDVTLSSDPDTAAAIAAGERSAQREFLDGRLRIG